MLKGMTDPLLALRNLVTRRRPLAVEKNAAPPLEAATASPSNPYIEARREWNERYGEYIHQAQQWRLVALTCAAVALVSAGGVVYIGAQSKIVPYVVEVDKLGIAAAIAPAEKAAAVDTRIIRAYLARFITDWRTVSVDPVAQKAAIDRLYAMLPNGSAAVSKINEHFRTNNPFAAAAKQRVAVDITDILKITDQTWQIEWLEVTRNLRGELTSSTRMKASIIVGITPSTDERLILANPLGVYATDLNWSRQL